MVKVKESNIVNGQLKAAIYVIFLILALAQTVIAKVTEYNFGNDDMRWQTQTIYKSDISIFLPRLNHPLDITILHFFMETEGHVQECDLHYSIPNVQILSCDFVFRMFSIYEYFLIRHLRAIFCINAIAVVSSGVNSTTTHRFINMKYFM